MKKLVLASVLAMASSGAQASVLVVDHFTTFLEAETSGAPGSIGTAMDMPPNGAIGDREFSVQKLTGADGLSAETSSLVGTGLSLSAAPNVHAIHTVKYGAVSDLGLDIDIYNALTFDVMFLDLSPVTFDATLTDGDDVSETLSIELDATAPPGYTKSFNLANFVLVDKSDIAMIEFTFDGLTATDLIIEKIAFEVPVPSALPLVLTGLAALGALRIRKKNS